MKYIFKTLLIICWMFMIFNFSSQNGEQSSSLSSGIIVKIVEIVKGNELSTDEKEKYIEEYSFIIRKLAHFSVYFVLGLLIYNLLKDFLPVTPVLFIYSLLFCIIYSCTDEIHQLFVGGRHGSIIDVLIDSVGSIIGISIYYICNKIKIKYSK